MKKYLPLLFIIGIVAILFYRVLFFGEVFVPGESLFGFPPWSAFDSEGPWVEFDLILMFYPWHQFAANLLKQGIIPLWNSMTLCGSPFVGCGQSGVFAPLHLLFLLLPLKYAFGIVAMLKLALLLSGFYLWMRTESVAITPALFGSIAFGFGGYNQYALGRANANVSLTLPWFCFLMSRFARRGNPLNATAAAMVLGIGALGGHIESIFYTYVFALTYVLFLFRHSILRGIGWSAGILAPALLIGAIQLYPFLDYLSQSMVLQDRSGSINRAATLPLGNLINLVMPDSSGNPWDGNYPIARHTYYEITAAFSGNLTLWFALWAILVLWRSPDLLFLKCWLSASLLGAYDVPGISFIFRSLPGFNLGYNVRLTYISLFCLAALGAHGLESALQVQGRRRPVLLLLAGIIAIVGLSAVLVPGFLPKSIEVTYAMQSWIKSLVPLLIGVVALGPTVKNSGRWFCFRPILILLITAVELVYFSSRYNDSVTPAKVFPPTKGIQFLQANSGAKRIAGIDKAIHPSVGIAYDLSDIRGYDSLAPRRYVELMMLMDSALKQRRADNVLQSVLFLSVNQNLLDLAGVKYLAVPGELWANAQAWLSSTRLKPVYADEMIVLENPTALDRVFFVPGAPKIAEESALTTMAAGGYDPHSIVVAEDMINVPPFESADTMEGAKIHWQEPHPGRLEIECQAPAAGMLVITENNLRGWRAWNNGTETAIYPVFHAFSGIPLAAGASKVILHYMPFSYSIGLFLTCLGFMSVGAWVMRSRFTKTS